MRASLFFTKRDDGIVHSPVKASEQKNLETPVQIGPPQSSLSLMKWRTSEEETLKTLYLKRSFLLEHISRLMQRSVPALSERIRKLNLPSRKKHTFRYPKDITPALARIHAHLCGDGYLYSYRVKDTYGPWAKYRKHPYRIRHVSAYTNTNHDLLDEFRRDIIATFGIHGQGYIGKPPKTEIRINSLRLYQYMKNLGAGNSRGWSVPDVFMHAPPLIAKSWIRAFFDDEADFDENSNGEVSRIRVKCVNKQGLLSVQKMLERFMPCNLTPVIGRYWGGTVCLNIRKENVPQYFREIGSLRYRPGICRKSSRKIVA